MVAGEAAFLFFNFLFLCWKIEETGSGLPEAQASFQAFDVLAVASGSLTKKKKYQSPSNAWKIWKVSEFKDLKFNLVFTLG